MASLESNFLCYLTEFIDFSANQKDLIDKLQLKQYIDDEIDFKIFLDHVLEVTNQLQEICKRAWYVHDFSSQIKDIELELSNSQCLEIKNALKESIKEFEFKIIKNGMVIEIIGNNLLMSEVMQKVEKVPEFLKTILEVRIIAKSVLNVDYNLENDKWSGKNFVVITHTLNILSGKNFRWDFSGKDQILKHEPNEKTDDKNGIDGKDGYPGESGGNVAIKAIQVDNTSRLRIISNGGKGGTGQNGSNGVDGENGKDVTQDVLDMFPSSASPNWHNGEIQYKAAYDNISKEAQRDPIKHVEKKSGTRWGNAYIKAILKSGFEVTYICHELQKCLLLVKGTMPINGGLGGKKGLGGEGGHPGSIKLYCPPECAIQIEKLMGNKGDDGISGYLGKDGIPGRDMGYFSYVDPDIDTTDMPLGLKIIVEIVPFFRGLLTPKSYLKGITKTEIYGDKKEQQLTLYYVPEDDQLHIQCEYLKEYVRIEYSGEISDIHGVRRYEQKNDSKYIRNRKAYALATKKNAINLEKIAEQYATHITRAKISFTANVEEQIQVEENKEIKIDQELHLHINKTFDTDKFIKRNRDIAESKEIPVIQNSTITATKTTELLKEKCNALNIKIKTIEGLNVNMIENVSSLKRNLEPFLKEMNNDINSPQLTSILNFKESLKEDENLIELLLNQACEHNITILFEMLKDPIFKTVNLPKSLEEKIVHENSMFEQFFLNQYSKKYYDLEKFIHALDDENDLQQLYYKSLEVKTAETELTLKLMNKNELMELYENFKKPIDKYCGYYIIPLSLHEINYITNYFSQCNTNSPAFLALAAKNCKLNVKFYTKSENGDLCLTHNHNPMSSDVIYLVEEGNEVKEMELDENLLSLNEYRQELSKQLKKVFYDIEQCNTSEEIKNYMEKNDTVIDCTSVSPVLYNCIVDDDISTMLSLFNNEAELQNTFELMKAIGAQSSIHYMAERLRITENPNITIRDIRVVCNSILEYGKYENGFILFDYMVLAYEPQDWIIKVILMRLENYVAKSLSALNKTWNDYVKMVRQIEEYLAQVENRNLLVLFSLKLNTTEIGSLNLEQLDEILKLLSCIKPDSAALSNIKLHEWSFVLKEYYWRQKLLQNIQYSEDDNLEYCVHLLLKINEKCGESFTNRLINFLAFKEIDKNYSERTNDIIVILNNIADDIWTMTNVQFDILKYKPAKEWILRIKGSLPLLEDERSTFKLVEIINNQFNNEATTKSVFKMKVTIDGMVESVQNANKYLTDFSKYTDYEIKDWRKKLIGRSNEDEKNIVIEMLAVINQAVKIWSAKQFNFEGFYLRDTQKLAALTILKHDSNTLLQVATGEGKSVTVATISIIKALLNQKVDIITTSGVLAKRDSDELLGLYEIFDLKVGHNAMDDLNERETVYKNCDVVYGDLGSFQRDFLLEQFYHKDVSLIQRNFQNVLVDEVDSMLLDKGNTTLYLSQSIPQLDKLESIYIHIWSRVVLGKTTDGGKNLVWETDQIYKEILVSLYGLIDEEDICSLAVCTDKKKANIILDILKNENIIDSNNHLMFKKFEEENLSKKLEKHSYIKELINPILFLLKNRTEREEFIYAPNYLKPFILQNLKKWIDNAKLALHLGDGDNYVIGGEDEQTVVTILDKVTGTDQRNSQWDACLHQFIQLKHGCRLTSQSLKAVFISNVSYFKNYKQNGAINGVSGTLGSEVERKHLSDTYNVNFLNIPTFKEKQFKLLPPIILSDITSWHIKIFNQCKYMSKRAVLIVCETVETAEQIYKYINKNKNQTKEIIGVHKYVRDFETIEFISKGRKLEQGHILIATNLAGRGTDLKLSDDVIKAGGLHVILTYFPVNDRIEQQAMGRAARKGEKGSGQLIIINHEFMDSKSINYRISKLISKRRLNEAEHVSNVREYYEEHIKLEEECFNKFKTVKENNSKFLSRNGDFHKFQDIIESAILDKWAFWLDTNISNTKDLDKDAITDKLTEFLETITIKSYDINDLIRLIDDITHLVRFGKELYEAGKIDYAIKSFNNVVERELEFCEGAYYYKALPLMIENKKAIDKNDIIKNTLMITRAKFEKRKEAYATAKSLIENLKRCTSALDRQSSAFEEQQEHIMQVYSTFITSIDDIVGHYADDSIFKDTISSDYERKIVFNLLKTHGFIEEQRFDPRKIDQGFKCFCKNYSVSFEDLKDFIYSYQARTVDFQDLTYKLKDFSVDVPNREEFWNILSNKGGIKEERKLYHISGNSLKDYDPTLYTEMKGKKKDEGFKIRNDLIYLYPNLLQEKYMIFTEQIYRKFVKERSLDAYLEDNGCLYINKCGLIDDTQLTKIDLEKFDSFCVQDLSDSKVLTKDQSEEFIYKFIELNLVEKYTTDTYIPTEKFYDFSFSDKNIEIPHIYLALLQEIIVEKTVYRNALRDLIMNEELNESTQISLPIKVYNALITEMIAREIISQPKTKNISTLDKLKTDLKKVFDGKFKLISVKKIPSMSREASTLCERLTTDKILEKVSDDSYRIIKPVEDGHTTDTMSKFLNTYYKTTTKPYATEIPELLYPTIGKIKMYEEKLELVMDSVSKHTPLASKKEEVQFKINHFSEIILGQKEKQKRSIKSKITTICAIVGIICVLVGIVLGIIASTYPTLLLLSGLFIFLVSTGGVMNLEFSRRFNSAWSQGQRAIRYIKSLLGDVAHGEKEKQKKVDRSHAAEKIHRTISSDIKRLTFASKIEKFQTILDDQINKLKDAIKIKTERDIDTAIANTTIRISINHLYEKYASTDVDHKLYVVDDRYLSILRISNYIEKPIKAFQKEFMENIGKLADEMTTKCLTSLTKFENSIKRIIENGVEQFNNQTTELSKTFELNVIKIYIERIKKIEKQLPEDSKTDLNATDIERRVDGKLKTIKFGITDAVDQQFTVTRNSNILREIKSKFMERLNYIFALQLDHLNNNLNTDIIWISEEELQNKLNVDVQNLNLTNNEFFCLKDYLESVGKINKMISEDINSDVPQMTTDKFNEVSEQVIKDVSKQKIIKIFNQNFRNSKTIFNDVNLNNKFIVNLATKIVEGNDSICKIKTKNNLDRLFVFFADSLNMYSYVLKDMIKLAKPLNIANFIYSKQDFYKTVLINVLQHNMSIKSSKTMENVVNIYYHKDQFIIAAFINPNQPFDWKTIVSLNPSIQELKTRLQTKEQQFVFIYSESDAPPFKHILAYLQEEQLEIPPELEVYQANGKTKINVKLLLTFSDNVKLKSPQYIPVSILDLLQEFLLSLEDVIKLAEYCEKNRNYFKKTNPIKTSSESINDLIKPSCSGIKSSTSKKPDNDSDTDED